jgi:hypothetical protein
MARPRFSNHPTGVHSLPVELLTRIFVLGAGFDYPYSLSPFLLKPDQDYHPSPCSNFQILVSHVCSHWRRIALRTSSLWTTLHFREPSHISRAQAYLIRCMTTGTHLLDILVDTVAQEDHLPGVTLCKDEIRDVFEVIIPHVKRWRAFHLKIRDNECKGQARHYLGSCGPAPRLETLQLYHFEDYQTPQNLYLATYRPPVIVFDNSLPHLKNVSLIGVNLPWAKSPYLKNLHNLELALHSDNIRPPYESWERMLRMSPDLQSLCLHYSGPRAGTGDPSLKWSSTEEVVLMKDLQQLSLTDLDPDYLCNLMRRVSLPALTKISLDLPEQDFTPFIELITSSTLRGDDTLSCSDTLSGPPLCRCAIPSLPKLEVLIIGALECSPESWYGLLQTLEGLRVLEADFSRVGRRFWDVLVGKRGSISGICRVRDERGRDYCERDQSSPLLPHLQTFKVSGITGVSIISEILRRRGLATSGDDLRWVVGWNERRRGKDLVLDELVDVGCRVESRSGQGWNIVQVETFDEGEEEEEEEEEGEECLSQESIVNEKVDVEEGL